MKEIKQTYEQGIRDGKMFVRAELEYEGVKERLFVAVCNTEKNKELLEEIPHEIREDLALVYHAYYDAGENGSASLLIRNDHLKLWGVDEDTLKADAWKSMRQILPSKIQSLWDAGMDIIRESGFECGEVAEETESRLKNTLVITNDKILLGAAYMFDPKTMDEAAKRLGDNLVVIPSSTHEILVMAEGQGKQFDQLRQMVQEVNRTTVRDEEVLSDEIYRYDREKQTLSVIPQGGLKQDIFPDSEVGLSDMHDYGYTWDGMLPLTKERALELMDEELLLFKLYSDGTEGMLKTKDEIFSHDGLFGVERESWISYLNAQSQNETNGMMQGM